MPISTVHRRIKKMEQDGIITGYKALINYEKTMLPIGALMQINLSEATPGNGHIPKKDIIDALTGFKEIEETVEDSHDALQSNACAAFSVEMDEQEQLVVVTEIKRTHIRQLDHAEVFDVIKMAVAEEHDIPVYAATLLSPGRMLKTSSGKIQRGACRQAWLNGTLHSMANWIRAADMDEADFIQQEPSIEAMKNWLSSWLSNKLGISPGQIDPDQPVMSYGLDSIGAVELEREVIKAFGIEISLIDFMENNTINDLARIGFNNYKNKKEQDQE